MPTGHHYGRTQTRAYTTQYHRIPAKVFKNLITAPIGDYSLNCNFLSGEHKKLKLTELNNGMRFMTFVINGNPHQIALKHDNSSASNKLYITCPYCQKQRQYLYVIKTAYACRECLKLHYPSQSERPQERLARRIRKFRKELWGYDWPEINNMFKNIYHWPKPKWLRWKTFNQKVDKIAELEKLYWPMAITQIKTTLGDHLMADSYVGSLVFKPIFQ